MFPNGYDWLEILAGRVKLVNSGLFLHALPRSKWLRESCADAGKIFLIWPDERMAGGVISVSDVSLVEDYDPIRHVERPRPDLSAGARRLKVGCKFNASLVGEPVEIGVFGDIALSGNAAGILLGDDGTHAHVLREGLKVVKWPLSGCLFRHPPQTNGSDFMARIALFPDGSLDRDAMTWLLGEPEDAA